MRCINGFLPLWCLKGGRAFLVADSPCLQLTFFPPSPQPPSRREGGDQGFFHARGCAPCIPATEPARHWEMGANQAPGGGHGGFACRIALPLWEPGGGHNGFGRRSIFYFSRFSAPIPPAPFPAGRGETLGYFMQGAAPLASPRLNPRGTGKWGRTKRPAGGTAVLLAGLLCRCGARRGAQWFWSPVDFLL